MCNLLLRDRLEPSPGYFNKILKNPAFDEATKEILNFVTSANYGYLGIKVPRGWGKTTLADRVSKEKKSLLIVPSHRDKEYIICNFANYPRKLDTSLLSDNLRGLREDIIIFDDCFSNDVRINNPYSKIIHLFTPHNDQRGEDWLNFCYEMS